MLKKILRIKNLTPLLASVNELSKEHPPIVKVALKLKDIKNKNKHTRYTSDM